MLCPWFIERLILPLWGNPDSSIWEIIACGIQNPGNSCLCNPESWALQSGLQLKEYRIPLIIGIRNPSSIYKETGFQELESGIQNPKLSWGPASFSGPSFFAQRRRPRNAREWHTSEWRRRATDQGKVRRLFPSRFPLRASWERRLGTRQPGIDFIDSLWPTRLVVSII